MPIYDYDGTALHQIGKVYDWDGTTSHQIGKVYDWDGTTSSLIYSGEEVIVQADGKSNVNAILKAWDGSNWTTVNYTVGEGDKNTSGMNGNIYVIAEKKDSASPFRLYENNSTIGYNGVQIYLDTTNIDFNSFSTLKFDFYSENTVGLSPSVAITNAIYTGNPLYYSGQLVTYNLAHNTTNKTYTLDVSDVNGTGNYIWLYLTANAEGSQTANNMYFSNFVLE